MPRYFRAPKTMSERRAADASARAKRNAANVPTAWDDKPVAARADRSWKRYRKTKWRPA